MRIPFVVLRSVVTEVAVVAAIPTGSRLVCAGRRIGRRRVGAVSRVRVLDAPRCQTDTAKPRTIRPKFTPPARQIPQAAAFRLRTCPRKLRPRPTKPSPARCVTDREKTSSSQPVVEVRPRMGTPMAFTLGRLFIRDVERRAVKNVTLLPLLTVASAVVASGTTTTHATDAKCRATAGSSPFVIAAVAYAVGGGAVSLDVRLAKG